MKTISITVTLNNTRTNETCCISLPKRHLKKYLLQGWSSDELQKNIFPIAFKSIPDFKGDKNTDLIELNSLLLDYEKLDPEDKEMIFTLFEAEDQHDLLHLKSVLRTYGEYEVIPDGPYNTIKTVLAEKVLCSIFDIDIASEIIDYHPDFFTEEVQTTLILVGLRAKTIIHGNDIWYVKSPHLVKTLSGDDDTLLFG